MIRVNLTSVWVDDQAEALGVEFTQEATDLGPVVTAVLDDTCGNLIQLAAMKA